MTPIAAATRPVLSPQLIAMAKRLVAGPIDLTDTTSAEDRLISRLEDLELVEMGTSTARLSVKGKQMLAAGGGTAPAPVAAPPAVVASSSSEAPRSKPRRSPTGPVIASAADLVWEEPPPPKASGRTGTHWFIPFVAPLSAKPGKWARVMTVGSRHLASIRAASARNYAKKHGLAIEAVARIVPSGSGSVYARFVGNGGK